VGQRLREAQVRVHVHQPDLAAEEGRALGALEVPLRAAVVVERPIEQARAVGAHQVLVDQAQVVLQLRAVEQALEDRVDHREDAVAHAGRRVARVQQVADASSFGIAAAGRRGRRRLRFGSNSA
jgi:hypothetical protein